MCYYIILLEVWKPALRSPSLIDQVSRKAISCALLHQQVMSPSTVLRHRRHQQQRGGLTVMLMISNEVSEVPLLPGGARDQQGRMQALEDGRVVEDRLIGQEVSMATPRGERAGGLLDGIDVPVPLTPLVTTSRGNHPDVERVAGEPRSYAPLFSQQQLHRMELMQSGARALYPNVLPGPSPPRTPMPPRSDPMRRPDFLRAEEVKRQKETWAQEERIRDLVWRQNEEVHRALQELTKRMRCLDKRMPC